MFDKFRQFFNRKILGPDERELYPHLFRQPINPAVTIGSIVLYCIVATAATLLVYWYIFEFQDASESWHLAFFAAWIVAMYPTLRMYETYKKQSKKIEENALCSTCRNYEETGLLCRLYDEHVSANYTPCEGNDWQPRPGMARDDDSDDEEGF